jgi:thiol-disulfide isomerase/thioredoxin
MAGLLTLIAAVVATTAIALVLRRRNGRFGTPAADVPTLTSADLAAPLGERATLVQFSSAFCAPCRATRQVLADVAGAVEGVVTIEIDAESHLDLVRRLGIMRTPTVLVLDARGAETTRASGLPRREQVVAALAAAV